MLAVTATPLVLTSASTVPCSSATRLRARTHRVAPRAVPSVVDAPAKKPLTRSLSAGSQAEPAAAAAAEGRFVQTIRGRATRSLSVSEREEIATLAKDKPNIDLEITFDYNSANISAKSLPAVQTLGRALTNPDLKGSAFIVDP